MPFQARNTYYLRISQSVVVPLHLYLDESHIEWMTERTLQAVVTDLKDLIGPKLLEEQDVHLGRGASRTNSKKGTVDVHRGDKYQFAYFLRKADPHYVLLKTRDFRMITPGPRMKPELSPPPSTKRAGKRKRDKPVKKTKAKSKAPNKRTRRIRDYSDDDDNEDDEEYIEIEESSQDEEPTSTLMAEEEEEKPKAAMELSYKRFDIQDRSVCVIVEPWPALPVPSTSEIQTNPTQKSGNSGDTEPLFLPDRDQSVVPSDSMDVDNPSDLDNLNLIAFSQTLTSFPGQGVSIEDDDDIDGDVLFADADETRGSLMS